MQTIQKYVTASLLITFLVTLLVVTFVLSIGVVFKVTDLLARGVSWKPIVRILVSGLPSALSFAIPISILTACLLIFGRMSADGEIIAMRASGMNLWHVTSTPRILALGLVILCIYINNELAPRSHFMRRQEVANLGMLSPLEMLDEGRFIQDFPQLTIYIGRRKEHRLFDIRIYDLRKRGVKRELRAKSGEVLKPENPGDLVLDLFDVRVDPFFDDRPGAMWCKRWPITIPDALKAKTYRKKEDDMTYGELLDGIINVGVRFPDLEAGDLMKQRMIMLVEMNKRLVLSFACYAFVLIGIPLGIRTHRKESSIGVAMSLFLMLCFYAFMVVAESFAKRPEMKPYLIMWLPVALSLALGTVLLNRTK